MNVQNDTLNIIRARINGRYTTILIDTGSGISAISTNFAKSLNVRIVPPGKGDPLELFTANKNSQWSIEDRQC